jgi:thiamine-phosphate pyrophosphorylase
MLVTDRRSARFPLHELALRAIDGGVDVVQIREKDLHGEELLRVVDEVLQSVRDRTSVIVNGDVDVARQLDIGVHLPERSLSGREARSILRNEAVIGRSVHSVGAAKETDGLNYLIAGHVFETTSKRESPPLGLPGLDAIAKATALPVLAIGGISKDNVRVALEQGAYGTAVVSAINGADDPGSAARAIRIEIDRYLESNMGTVSNRVATTINGKPVELVRDTTIKQFLEEKGYHDRLVVVEVNEVIVPRSGFDSTTLRDGDRIEIVHFVGGG